MSFTEEDKIGRQDIVDKISSLVDNLQKDEHFCLALDGEWGSGKSYVMDMLREKFAVHPEYIVINYDAWKNNFYSDPLIAILYCVLDSIKEYVEFSELKIKLKQGTIKTLKSWGKKALSAMEKAGGKYTVLACIIEAISNVISASGKLSNNELLAGYKSYQSLIEEVKNQLNNLASTEIYNDKPTKLIIMVDEIDRCLPNEQLIILERIHHLFDVKNCAIIVAMNKRQIIKVFDTRYGSGGKEYLRKFFKYNYHIEANSHLYFINAFIDELHSYIDLKLVSEITINQIDFIYMITVYYAKNEFSKSPSILNNNVEENIDNRTMNTIISHIMKVILGIPEHKVDFAYVLLISLLVCFKLYNKSLFFKLKNKSNQNEYIDVFTGIQISSSFNQVIGKMHTQNGVNIYSNKALNTVNYYLNMWNVLGYKNNEDLVHQAFLNYIDDDANFKDKLKYIFEQVDCISE